MSQRVDKDSLPLDQPRRTPNHPTKSHIVKTKVDGKEKIIRFGEQGASTAGKPKAGESDRMKQKRASFKARHAKNIAKGKSSPAYWANKVKWAEGGEVKMARGGSAAMALLEQMRRSGNSPEFNAVEASLREQRMRPRRSVVPPPQQRQAVPQAEELPLPPVPPAMRPDENPPPEAPRSARAFDEGNPFVATAIQMAERYNLPRDVFLSLVRQESNFNPAAVSPRGAIGLGQLMPGTARELGVDPNDPVQNLEGSARYLRRMLDRFGDMPLALAAYNAGPTRVALSGNTIPNIRETQNYVQTIMRNAGASGFAEGGLAELDSKYADGNVVTAYDPDAVEARIRSVAEPEGYAEGGRVRRTLRDELRDIEAEVRGERPASLGVTVARGMGEDFGGIAGTVRRVGSDPRVSDFVRRFASKFGASPEELLREGVDARQAGELVSKPAWDQWLEASGDINAARAGRLNVGTQSDYGEMVTDAYLRHLLDTGDEMQAAALIGRLDAPVTLHRGMRFETEGEMLRGVPHNRVSELPGLTSYTDNPSLAERFAGSRDVTADHVPMLLRLQTGEGLRGVEYPLSNPEFSEVILPRGSRVLHRRRVAPEEGAHEWDAYIRSPESQFLEGEVNLFAQGGLAQLEQKYSEGGSADSGSDGGGSSDDSGGASTSDATSSVSDAIGAGYGPESSGYGNQGGPGPNASGGMSAADPEGTSQAANMSTAMSAQNAGLGYGIADTGGVAPTGFSNAPSLAEAASAFSRGDIGFQQALGLGLQSAFSPPGVQIGTMTDALGLQSQAASINPVGLGAGIAGTALGLATGIPGLGLAAGYLGSKIGDSLGIAPSIVSYTPGEGPVSNVDTGGETNFLYPNYVERLGTDLASLNQKYAEGGQVSIAQYNPAAVDALVKKIEAEYV